MEDDAIINRLGALSLALADAQAAAAERASGLGTSACAALVTVGVEPETTIGELAKVLRLTHSVTVRLVESLAADGFVERRRGHDRRRVMLRLTEDGTRMRALILEARAAALAMAVAGLNATERDELGRCLEPLLATLTQGREVGDHICRLCDEDACGPGCPVERAAARHEEGGA